MMRFHDPRMAEMTPYRLPGAKPKFSSLGQGFDSVLRTRSKTLLRSDIRSEALVSASNAEACSKAEA